MAQSLVRHVIRDCIFNPVVASCVLLHGCFHHFLDCGWSGLWGLVLGFGAMYGVCGDGFNGLIGVFLFGFLRNYLLRPGILVYLGRFQIPITLFCP